MYRRKYPRTPHLPWSEGADGRGDVTIDDPSMLLAADVIVTEKMDGENTTLYREGLHARSLDSGFHPSRSWVLVHDAAVASAIPEGWRVCGENVYARHAIAYDALPSYFLAFSVWADVLCLGWDNSVEWFDRIGVTSVPTLYRGRFDRDAIHRAWLALEHESEGYVVRVARSFDEQEFPGAVAKFVRAGHVQSDTHWARAPVVPNALA